MFKLVLLVTFCTALIAGKEIGSSGQVFDVDVQIDQNRARLESVKTQLYEMKAIHDMLLSLEDGVRMFDEFRAKREATPASNAAEDPEPPKVQPEANCCG